MKIENNIKCDSCTNKEFCKYRTVFDDFLLTRLNDEARNNLEKILVDRSSDQLTVKIECCHYSKELLPVLGSIDIYPNLCNDYAQSSSLKVNIDGFKQLSEAIEKGFKRLGETMKKISH